MPAGGGGKGPAGGYRAGKKGSYGCSGYPTVSADGTVHGCHKTKEEAATQARAIWASVNSEKADLPLEHFMEEPDIAKSWSIAQGVPGCEGFAVVGSEGDLKSCHTDRASAEAALAAHNADEMSDDEEDDDKGLGIKNPEEWPTNKRDGGKFPASMGQPHAASNGESVVKDPKKKPKRSIGGVGTAGVGTPTAKSDEEKTDAELFAGFGKDFTRVERRLEVFLPQED